MHEVSGQLTAKHCCSSLHGWPGTAEMVTKPWQGLLPGVTTAVAELGARLLAALLGLWLARAVLLPLICHC